MSYFQRVKPQCKVEILYTTCTQKKLTHTVLRALVDTGTLCLKLSDAFISTAHTKHLVLLSLRKKFRGLLKRESWPNYENKTNKEKVVRSLRCTKVECDCRKMYMTDKFFKQHLCEACPYKILLREERL